MNGSENCNLINDQKTKNNDSKKAINEKDINN